MGEAGLVPTWAKMTTAAPPFVLPLKLGVLLLVMKSVLEIPVSLAGLSAPLTKLPVMTWPILLAPWSAK